MTARAIVGQFNEFSTVSPLIVHSDREYYNFEMTKDQVQLAMDEGIPFVIKMADGNKYEVMGRYQVALGRTTVVVMGKKDLPHVLPLLTMTGISYLKPKKLP